MRFFLGAGLLSAALIFMVPVMVGGNADICRDAALRNTQRTQDMLSTNGAGTEYDVVNPAPHRHHRPRTPLLVSCTAAFWESL